MCKVKNFDLFFHKVFLVVELAEQCHSSLYPVFLRLVRGQFHAHHKVGGVTSGGEGPSAITCLVEGDGV